jgi:enoyl-CoA hydratase/carnithine racemase
MEDAAMYNEYVKVEHHEGWAEMILDRPERRNALIGPMIEQLTHTVRMLAMDDSVQAIVFRGAGGCFSSGHDLKELQLEPRPAWALSLGRIFREANIALFEFPKPIVGALEGYAINAGAALALSCDILIAGESAVLQVGEIQQGAGVANNVAWLRLRAGEAAASRIVLYGERIPAAELHRLGLTSEVVPDADVLVRARIVAARLAGFPPGSPARIKAAVRAQSGITDPREWFTVQSSAALLSANKVS